MKNRFLSGLASAGFLVYFIYQFFFAYGSSVSFGTDKDVYYTEGATEAEAQALVGALKKMDIFSNSSAVSIQLQKDGDAVVIRYVLQDGAWNDQETQDGFGYISYMLGQDAFPGKTIKVDLCDDEFNTKKSLVAKAPPEMTEEEPVAAEEQPEPAATP